MASASSKNPAFKATTTQACVTMNSFNFSAGGPVPASLLLQLATSSALNEISNASGAIRNYVLGEGLVKDGRTRRTLFFAIYQTGRFGPQNGFRLCLVHEGFELSQTPAGGESDGGQDGFAEAGADIAQGTMEFIVLGTAPEPIADPA